MKITYVTWLDRDDGTPCGPNGVPSLFAWRRVTVSADKPRKGRSLTFHLFLIKQGNHKELCKHCKTCSYIAVTLSQEPN